MANSVRVLTIHKAKGLENERVIVADVARDERYLRPEAAVKVARAAGRSLPAIAAGRRLNAARILFEEDERRHWLAEETRVLYVALTRARDHLTVVTGPARRWSTWVNALRAWGFDPDQPPDDGSLLDEGRVLHRSFAPRDVKAPAAPDARDEAAAVAAYLAAAEIARGAASQGLHRPSNEQPALGDDALPSETSKPGALGPSPERATARAVGTVVHALLRRPELDLGNLEGHAQDVAGPASALVGADRAEVVRESVRVVKTFLESQLALRLRKAKVRGRELPIVLDEDERIWSGTLDLLLEEDGELVVVDYKTDREDPEALVDRYRAQLAVYARAIARTLSLPKAPRAELWALRSGRSIVVPPEGR
jgi:ATP-dependent helicase/nuclease subunit A